VKGSSSSALATLGKATVLTAVIGLGMAYLPFGPVVLTPFVVLPLAYTAVSGETLLFCPEQ